MIKIKSEDEKYEVLKKHFETWFLEKYTSTLKELKFDPYPVELLKFLNISQKKFDEIYIKPFRELDKNLLGLALKSLCANLQEETSTPDYIYSIHKQPRISQKLNALQWLLPQIEDLKMFELPENVRAYYKKPVRQCLYCGKPNYYVREGKQISFNNKTRFCHKDNCIVGESNLSLHDDECHHKKWRAAKKKLNQNLKRSSQFYMGEKWHDVNVDNKLIRTFLKFCEKQYEENLKIEYTIQYYPKWPGGIEELELVEAMHYSELL